MRNLIFVLIFMFTINSILAQSNIVGSQFEIEKIFHFPRKSKIDLFILTEQFVNFGWQAPKDVSTVTFDEFISGIPPKYDYNNPIQLIDKEKGIIKSHIISRFHTKFHSANTNSIWFEYDIEFKIKDKVISIIISDINTDEFVSDEQKISESYKTIVNNLENELKDIPSKFIEFIGNN